MFDAYSVQNKGNAIMFRKHWGNVNPFLRRLRASNILETCWMRETCDLKKKNSKDLYSKGKRKIWTLFYRRLYIWYNDYIEEIEEITLKLLSLNALITLYVLSPIKFFLKIKLCVWGRVCLIRLG